MNFIRQGFTRRAAAGLALAAGLACGHAQPVSTLLESSRAWGMVTADLDGDGPDDLWVCGHDFHNDRVWYWTASGYVPSPQLFPPRDRHDCDAADVDGDGRLDLYCAIGAEKGTGVKANELWMQGADGRFTLALNSGVEDPYGRARIPLFFDFDHDGFPDLYVTNDATDRGDGQPNYNHVFVNQGGHGFVEATTVATGKRGFQCVAKGDIDHDGWDDLLVCDSHANGHLYVNNRQGDFIELLEAPTTMGWNDAKLVDLDGDGLDDLVALTNHGQYLRIWLNTGTTPHYDAQALARRLPLGGVSLAVGDFNHDGARDIYIAMQDAGCATSGVDRAPDIVFWGRPHGGWVQQTLAQDFAGCGHLAGVLDGDKVLLENGGVDLVGPSYVIDWSTSGAAGTLQGADNRGSAARR